MLFSVVNFLKCVGQGVRGRSPPPEAESILTLKRANSALSLKSNASNLEQSTPVNKRRI